MRKGQAINLVSFEARDSVRFEMLSIFIFRLGMATFLQMFIFITFLLTSLFYVKSINMSVEKEIEMWSRLESSAESSIVKQDIQHAINFINESARLSEGSFRWSSTVESIIKALPQNIRFLTLKGTQDQKSIILSGVAPTREDVLLSKEALAKMPFVKDINSPLSNVVPGRDINFNFTLVLK